MSKGNMVFCTILLMPRSYAKPLWWIATGELDRDTALDTCRNPTWHQKTKHDAVTSSFGALSGWNKSSENVSCL